MGRGSSSRRQARAPLVVLLHGFPDTPHGWGRIASGLADAGYRAVRPWLRGYHPATIVEGRPYDPVTLGSDPTIFLDALGEQEAILVGHDWGASVVYAAATLHPDRVRAIVPIGIPHPTLLPRNSTSCCPAIAPVDDVLPVEWRVARNWRKSRRKRSRKVPICRHKAWNRGGLENPLAVVRRLVGSNPTPLRL